MNGCRITRFGRALVRTPQTLTYPTMLAAVAFIGLCVLISGCGSSGTDIPERYSIESMQGDFGLVGRSVIKCPAGDCILVHFPPEVAEFKSLNDGMTEGHTVDATVKSILRLDDADSENDGEIMIPDARWGGAEADQVSFDTFNCCAFAVGDLLDLREGDWLNPAPRNTTNQTRPFQIVLDSYFREVLRASVYEIDWASLESSTAIHEGDLVCFSSTMKDLLEVVHVGVVQKRNGKNWLVSKIGLGPIVRGTMSATGKAYLLGWDVLVVYRQK